MLTFSEPARVAELVCDALNNISSSCPSLLQVVSYQVPILQECVGCKDCFTGVYRNFSRVYMCIVRLCLSFYLFFPGLLLKFYFKESGTLIFKITLSISNSLKKQLAIRLDQSGWIFWEIPWVNWGVTVKFFFHFTCIGAGHMSSVYIC